MPPPQPTSLEVLGREVSGLRDGGAEQFRGFSHTSLTPTPNWPVRCRREMIIEALLVTVNVPKQGSRLPVGGEGGGVGGGDVLAGGLLLDLNRETLCCLLYLAETYRGEEEKPKRRKVETGLKCVCTEPGGVPGVFSPRG